MLFDASMAMPLSGARVIGAVSLLGLPSVMELGGKLQRAGITLGFDRHASTELATVVVDAGRRILTAGQSVTVALRHGRVSGNLLVEVIADEPSTDLGWLVPVLQRGFDAVWVAAPSTPGESAGPRDAAVSASRRGRTGQTLPSERALAQARKQFAERSRDALLLQVKRQNDDLEARVAARTEEVEKALREAKEANDSKSVFLSSMSHELRTPLNGVLGYAQLLQYDPSMTAEHRDKLGGIESCAKHLLGLIGELLDFSKIEAGKLELLIGGCDVAELLESVIDIVRSRVRADAVTLRLDNQVTSGILFRTDEAKLRQVFVNLLGNSAKFTSDGEIVLLAEECEGDRLRFTVTDTGPGLTAEELERLFEPFRQGQAGHSSGGTGLGLTISKSIVEGLEGTISATSQYGEGASFVVELPRIAAVAERREATAEGHDPSAVSLAQLSSVVCRLAEGEPFDTAAAGLPTGVPKVAIDCLQALVAQHERAALERFAAVVEAVDLAGLAA